MQAYNLVSFMGIFILIGTALLISRYILGNKQVPNISLAAWALGL